MNDKGGGCEKNIGIHLHMEFIYMDTFMGNNLLCLGE